jgi:hypothetical protein
MLVSDVMQATVLTITPKTAARSHTPGGQGRLIGIVTETDVLELSVRGMGAGRVRSMDPRAATASLEACGYTVRDPRKG